MAVPPSITKVKLTFRLRDEWRVHGYEVGLRPNIVQIQPFYAESCGIFGGHQRIKTDSLRNRDEMDHFEANYRHSKGLHSLRNFLTDSPETYYGEYFALNFDPDQLLSHLPLASNRPRVAMNYMSANTMLLNLRA